MKRYIFFYCLLIGYWSCTCEDHELLIQEEDIPDSFCVTSIDSNLNFIIINFNLPLDPNSVKIGSSLVIEINNAEYTGTPIIETQSILLDKCDFNCDPPSCLVSLKLIGNADGIKSTLNGQILDGDKDGIDGGEYATELIIDSCIFPELPPSVTSPPNDSITVYDLCADSTKLVVFVEFSNTMDASTFDDMYFFTEFEFVNQGYIEEVGKKWNEDTTIMEMCFFTQFCDGCKIILNILESTVKGANGKFLDGNNNGLEGGIYQSTIEINEATTYVLYPTANQTGSTVYSINNDTAMVIDVGFSDKINIGSINNSTITLTHLGSMVEVPLKFTWEVSQFLTITSAPDIYDYCGESCFFTLKINTGPGDIIDLDSVILDPNRDCIPGDLFQTTYILF